MFNRWNNAPWTARGLIFKHTIEALLGTLILFLAVCEPTRWK